MEGLDDLVEHRTAQQEIRELGVELRAAAAGDSVVRNVDGAFALVAAAVRDDVEGIGEGDDARLRRNVDSLEPARIAAAIPALVVREDAVVELRIEGVERTDDIRAQLRVRDDERALLVG